MDRVQTTFQRESERETADYCSRQGSEVLKQRIESYWAARGMSVTVCLAVAPFHPALRAARFDVRSDMTNGMPRSSATRAAAKENVVRLGDFVDEASPDEKRHVKHG
jgi:hypothetical protein